MSSPTTTDAGTAGAGGAAGAGALATDTTAAVAAASRDDAKLAAQMSSWDKRALELPVVDVAALALKGTDRHEEFEAACAAVAASLHDYGVIVVKDGRASQEDNSRFIDMIESYFEQEEADKLRDVRADVHYQVGPTPSFMELPRNHCSKTAKLDDGDEALSLCPPERDPKWRYLWHIGDRPEVKDSDEHADLHPENVVPERFSGTWPATMDAWGAKLLGAAVNIAEMAAHGFGLPEGALHERMSLGAHLLAPTATDLKKHGTLGRVLAGYHYDLGFITVHGKSRFSALYIWTRDGRKLPVKVPDGCLLMQAGAQFEYVTGGHVLAGFHEVVVGPKTLAQMEKTKAAGGSLWRVSSTMFTSIRSSEELQPYGRFATEETLAKYPPITAGAHTKRELEAIRLTKDTSSRAEE